MLLILMLYLMSSYTALMVVLILFMEFDYYMLIIFEFYTLMFFYLVVNNGSSYERGGANVFIMVFGFVLSFGVVISNSLLIIGLVLLTLGIANLPIYGLHIWLPKVHVEASILGSMVLAGAVLNLSIVYIWNFGSIMIVGAILIMSTVVILSVIDGNSFAAYSSVLHMSICVIVGLYVMLLVSYIHIVLSPLIFITVYKMYSVSGSRFYMKVGLLMIVLWIVNFGLPFLGSFFSEVYIIQNGSIMIVSVVLIYMIVGYVMMNSLNIDSNSLFYIPWLVLYIIVM